MSQFHRTMKPGDFIAVGRVVASQGNCGEVRVLPFTDFPQQFSPGLKLRVKYKDKAEVETLKIENIRQYKNVIILKFVGIQCIDGAKALRGAVLEVPKEDLVPLPENCYYVFEIEGLKVLTVEGIYLGRIIQVINGVANDIYEVAHGRNKPGSRKNILIPAVQEIVKDINPELGTMTVDLIPGFR